MSWRDRDDVWNGLAFLRPVAGSANIEFGGGFCAFFVTAHDIRAATERLFAAFAEEGWLLTSFEEMKRACDYRHDEGQAPIDEVEQERLAALAADQGVALGSYHIFPVEDSLPL